MADVVSPEVRSRMMAGIRSKDTRPEMMLRRALHAGGFRYRLHVGHLPGKPDLVFPRWRAVVFVHGCFWHGHGCRMFRWPKSREQFWRDKIGRNCANDIRHLQQLEVLQWRTAIVWECATRNRENWPEVVAEVAAWLCSGTQHREWEAA
nr:DNA mismatch endonuclease Vsr [uncultured Gellertiella sp.]